MAIHTHDSRSTLKNPHLLPKQPLLRQAFTNQTRLGQRTASIPTAIADEARPRRRFLENMMRTTRTVSSAPGAMAAAAAAAVLLLLVSASATAFLSPLPATGRSVMWRGGAAGGGTRVAAAMPRAAGPFFLFPPRSQQRLFASVDTEEKETTTTQETKAMAVVDPKAQQELERLLAEGSDLLGLVEHLQANRKSVKLTWDQVSEVAQQRKRSAIGVGGNDHAQTNHHLLPPAPSRRPSSWTRWRTARPSRRRCWRSRRRA